MKFNHRTSVKWAFTIFCCSFLFSGYAQSSLFSFEKFVNGKGDTLLYRQLFPDYDTLRKYPLVIFLHGSGERGKDNEAQLKWGVKNFATDKNMKMYPAFVIAPQCPANDGWSNFSESKINSVLVLKKSPTKPMELVIALVYELTKKFPIDPKRIYITGLSMGGYGTFDAIERYPNLFAAAVPVCGGGDVSLASSIKHIPIWIFHGAEDSVVPAAFSRNMVEALTKAGAHPGYTQYPEVGHFSWIAAYNDPLLMAWLFRQFKKQ
jgi:predicted peptidase